MYQTVDPFTSMGNQQAAGMSPMMNQAGYGMDGNNMNNNFGGGFDASMGGNFGGMGVGMPQGMNMDGSNAMGNQQQMMPNGQMMNMNAMGVGGMNNNNMMMAPQNQPQQYIDGNAANYPPMNIMSVASGYGNVGGGGGNVGVGGQYQPYGSDIGEVETDVQSKPNFNLQEIACYRHYWRMLDPRNTGVVEENIAAEFFAKSGLAHSYLHKIFNLVDPNSVGMMDEFSFATACRLVAHVQNGNPLVNDAMYNEPTTLPNFNFDTQISSEGGDSGKAINTFKSQKEFQTTKNVQAAAWEDMISRLPTKPTNQLDWSISEEFQLKYRTFFNEKDQDYDGFINGNEARVLFAQSGLSRNELMLIWSLADQDKDGRLNMNEFAVAVHLIHCRNKNMPIPDVLPPELYKIVVRGLVSSSEKDNVVGGRPTGINTVETVTEQSTVEVSPLTAPQQEQPQQIKQQQYLAPPLGYHEAARPYTSQPVISHYPPTSNNNEEVTVTTTTKKQQQQQARQEYVAPPAKPQRHSSAPKSYQNNSMQLVEVPEKRVSIKDSGKSIQSAGLSEPLVEYIVEGDKRINKSLAMDVTEFADELQHVNQASDNLKDEVAAERYQIARQMERKRDFRSKLEEQKVKLEKLKEERRRLELEKVAVARDVQHYEGELNFLKKQVDDARNDIKQLQAANLSLEKTHMKAEGYITTLDTARKGVTHALRNERHLLIEEEREIAELRNALEKVKRDKDEAQARNAVLQERLRQADQDRMLLMTSIESERAKLISTKDSRLRLADERQAVAQEMANVAQQAWMQNNSGNDQMVASRAQIPNKSTRGPYSISYGLPRDAKGVPTSAVAMPPPIHYNSSRGWTEREKPLPSWTEFGLSKKPTVDYIMKGAPRRNGNEHDSASNFRQSTGFWENSEYASETDGDNAFFREKHQKPKTEAKKSVPLKKYETVKTAEYESAPKYFDETAINPKTSYDHEEDPFSGSFAGDFDESVAQDGGGISGDAWNKFGIVDAVTPSDPFA